MTANLNEIFEAHGISEEEILRRSTRLERWRPEDRDTARARARVRMSGSSAYQETALGKPRSGRGIGRKHLRAALAGQAIPRVPRAKLQRALSDALRRRGVEEPRPAAAASVADRTIDAGLEAGP